MASMSIGRSNMQQVEDKALGDAKGRVSYREKVYNDTCSPAWG